MTIEEVKNKKKKVEKEISDILKKFTDETDTNIETINLYTEKNIYNNIMAYIIEMEVKL